MVKLLDKISAAFAVAGAILLLFVSFSIGYSIFTRKLGLPSPIWIVQINEYSLLWITFLGTAWLLANDKHVSIRLLTDFLDARSNRILALIHDAVGAVLSAIFCWYGTITTYDHLVRNVIDIQAIEVKKGLVLMIIPIGFFLLCLQFIKKFFVLLNDGKESNTKSKVEESVRI